MSGITVRPVTTAVGAVIEGVSLGEDLPEATIAAIRAALNDRGVVFFRGQDLTSEQFWSFAARFGQPLKDETTGTAQDRPEDAAIMDFAHARKGTCVWHADTTSLARPPWGSLLRNLTTPECGGDTCWSSMYAAWDALSDPMRAMLDGLTAVHSIRETYDRMEEYGANFAERYDARHAREQVHPIALVHPETGRKALFVNESFTTRIVELSTAESATLLPMLFRHVGLPFFTMRWRWTPGDVAFWDNRSTQHFAVPDYESGRVMQRIVLKGERPGGEAAARQAEAALAG